MTSKDRADQQRLARETEENAVDPGAAPGVSDAGSAGHLIDTSLAGVGTGTSIGPSRGNTGPGTGSDEMEAHYGEEPPSRLTEMVGVGPERPGGDEGSRRRPDESAILARERQAVNRDATAPIVDSDPGTTDSTSSTAGLGDNDIPAETEIP
jgi:hypothetical protein